MAKHVLHKGEWVEVTCPQDVGRKDWHHDENGNIDYPIFKEDLGKYPEQEAVPLDKQKYDYETQNSYEVGAQNLIDATERKPDWREYDRVMKEFN